MRLESASSQHCKRLSDIRDDQIGILHVPKRLLADFIIGSHALAQADRFMTLDPKRYERDFPEPKLT